MDSLRKRRVTDFGESQDGSDPSFLDLAYTHSNSIFHLLVREGFVKDDGSRETLATFLEIVSFVHCWMEMELERHLPRKTFEELSSVFSDMKTSWGAFFANAPEEPKLQHESVESIFNLITRRCAQYHASYLSGLRADGPLHALRTCCAAFLENALPGWWRALRMEGVRSGQERTTSLDHPILHYIGETLYELNRGMQYILAEHMLYR
jgi:hypothetical protein